MFFLLALVPTVNAQTSLINSLNENLLEVSKGQGDGNTLNLNAFNLFTQSANIFAIGEETHGIKEFTDFRAQAIKHLVSNLKYRVIVLEADFYGTQTLNNYIQEGKGNRYYALLSTGMGIYRTPEFLDIVEWIREYNTNKPKEEQVSFYGCDMQKSAAIAYISTGNFKLNRDLSPLAMEGLKLLLGPVVNKINSDDKKKLNQLISEIKEELLSHPDTSMIARSLVTILQYGDYFQETYNYDRSRSRDKYMAENVMWIYEHENKRRMILLAHNGHIAKSPVGDDIKNLGNYLKEKYNDGYYALGAGFYTGTFSAGNVTTSQLEIFTMPETKDAASSEFIFSQCKVPNFILDFKTADRYNDIKIFLNKKTFSRNIGATYDPTRSQLNNVYMPLDDKFDGIVFFRNVTPLPFPFKWDKR